MVNKFNKFAEELGWFKPYKSVALWLKERDAFTYKVVFDIGNYSSMENLDKAYVMNTLEKFFNHNIFEKKNKNWILPMLASDYFAHKYDFKKELIWAKKAMRNNSRLTPLQFSSIIREKLK